MPGQGGCADRRTPREDREASLLLVAALVVGQVSGNQPERDAVEAARAELGIALESRRIDVGDVVGLMDALGLDSAHVAAQDVGGGLGWRLVLEHPERVRSYAVISVPHPLAHSVFEGEVDEVSWHRTLMRIPWLPGFSARVADWWLLTSNLRKTSVPGAFPEDERDLLRSAWDRDGAAYSMTAQWRASDWPYDGDGRIARPVLVIFAPDDVYFTEEVTKLSLRFLDAGELVELDSGTHWVAQEQPERIGEILAGFFGRTRR